MTRAQLRAAIEAGIEVAGLTTEQEAALRDVAETATEVGVGSYKCCPVTLAGIYPVPFTARDEYYMAMLPIARFVSKFDSCVNLPATDWPNKLVIA